MTKTEIEMKMKEIGNQQKFKEEMLQAKTFEEMIEVLKQYGIEVTVEELQTEIMPLVSDEGELTEESLEQVVGGGGWLQRKLWGICRWFFNQCGIDIGEYYGD